MAYPTVKGKGIYPLGFGFMRLPVTAEGNVDYAHSRAMMERAVEAGINYFDTAMLYHGGESEIFLGKETTPAIREKVTLATKMPTWLVKSPSDMDKFLDEQLVKLKTDCIDIYLLHSLNLSRWETLRRFDVLEFLERAKSAGKIRMTGFSFHDGFPLFKEVVDSYKWDIAQIQLNILDAVYQAGIAGAKYAHEKGAFVVIMEPLKGGILAMPIEGAFAKIAQKHGWSRPTFVDLCLKWLWNKPEIGVVLSGMSSLQQLSENIGSAEDFVNGKGAITQKELDLIDDIRAEFNSRIRVGCTGCAYCRPCPENVDVLECFRIYNSASITGNWKGFKSLYENVIFHPSKQEKRASFCAGCGVCETRCPQNLPIREKLKEVVKDFEEVVF
ncbi:MAG: aldo/keto reductase [Synergistaceae bacterium]|nr:aldo/keto reductase [Synergistaceae bacterium]